MSGTEKASKGRRAMSRRVWVVAGVLAFVAVDILLVALALGWGRAASQAAGWQTSDEDVSQTREDSEETPDDPQPSPDSEETQAVPRLLSVVSETVAWRSEGGTCSDRGEIELTVDGGETWGSAYPAAEGLGRPLWISGADYTAVQAVIASGRDCLADGVRTFDSGATWSQEDQVVANSVFVDPLDSSALQWGGERIEGPCSAISQVAVTGGTASAVCQDGSLWNLDAQDGSWEQIAEDGVIAVNGSDGRWVAAVESPDCEGLSLVEFGDESPQPVFCAPVELGEATAVDFLGTTVWVWIGDQVSVSANLGGGPDS